MNWQRKLRLVIDLIVMVAMVVCATHFVNASRTKPCKTDPRIIQHDDNALENPNWKCVPVGYNAQLKGPVYWCTNKITGAVWQITILPVKVPTKD